MTHEISSVLFSLAVLLLIIPGTTFHTNADEDENLRLMSFNIRYDNENDGDDAWTHRKDLVLKVIRDNRPHVIGMQEVLHHQKTWLEAQLPEYASVGVGRKDGKTEGEYSPLFYDTTRLELLNSGTFWLSKSPDKPGSKSWDAAITRICTWAQCKDVRTGKTFFVFNTHYDHEGERARLESTLLILKQIEARARNAAVVVMGDLNARPESHPVKGFFNNGFFGVADLETKGPDWTFHGFDGRGEAGNLIDYILLNDHWQCFEYRHVDYHQGDRWPSDHLPVLTEVAIK